MKEASGPFLHQIGFVFDGVNTIRTRENQVVEIQQPKKDIEHKKKNQKPLQNQLQYSVNPEANLNVESYDETTERLTKIWNAYLKIREERSKKSINNHIYFIPYGVRIDGKGRNRNIGGKLRNDILACIKKGSGSLELIHSFNPINNKKANYLYFKDNIGYRNGTLTPNKRFCAYKKFDLNVTENLDDFINQYKVSRQKR